MKRFVVGFLFLWGVLRVWACTSAIVTGNLTSDGRPLLWKHRDTSDLNNKVEKISSPGKLSYVALFNASDSLCREAWMGMNEVGFAIMNTASYNLKDDDIKDMDKEGLVMSKALAECHTVDDFARLILLLPKPLGVEANFGVIDAYGGAAYFETDNWSYKRFDVDGCMVRTNYSYSGRKDEGYGYVREKNALHILKPYIDSCNLTPAVFTEVASRSFYHSLLNKDFVAEGAEWVSDTDFIPRRISSASIVVQCVTNPAEIDKMVMWTVLGYPPCGVVSPVTIDNIPTNLRADTVTGRAPACDRANELKQEVFPYKKRGDGKNYVHLSVLFNSEDTGIAQRLRRESLAVYQKYGIYLK